MKSPRSAASMVYSGQCRCHTVNAPLPTGGMSSAAPPRASRCRLSQHLKIEPERFAHGPGLEGAAPRNVRGLRVGDLADVSHSGLIQMPKERLEKLPPRLPPDLRSVALHSDPRFHKWSHQPGPNRALIIAAVARRHASLITRHVAAVIRRQGAKPERGPEFGLHSFDDPPGERLVNHRVGESAHCENLIGPKRRIVYSRPVIDIQHVVQVAAGLVPEPPVEGVESALEYLAILARQLLCDPERVEPERLDLDRLPDSRRHHPVAHLGAHPGELYARLTAGDESVGVQPNSIPSAPAISGDDAGDCSRERAALDGRERVASGGDGAHVVVNGDDVPEGSVHR